MATEEKSEYMPPNGDWKTLYSTNYRANQFSKPRKQYYQPHVFESEDTHKVPVREFPYIPQAPKRMACYDIPIGPGLTTPDMKAWTYLRPKSILKRPSPRATGFREPKPSSRKVKWMIPETEGEWPIVNQPSGKRWRTVSAFKHAKSILGKSLPSKCLNYFLGNSQDDEDPIDAAEINDKQETSHDRQHLAGGERSVVPEETCEKLRHYYRWTSSAQRAMHDCHPNVDKSFKSPKYTVFEPRADEVSYRRARYAPCPEDYQAVGPAWDRVQARALFGRRSPVDKDKETPLKTKWPTHIPRPQWRNTYEEKQVEQRIRDLIRTDNLSAPFQRPLPRYAGFVPRQQTESKLEKLPDINSREGVTILTHKKFPDNEYYSFPRYPHPSVISKSVTLTSPYNPFNKVEPTINSNTIG